MRLAPHRRRSVGRLAADRVAHIHHPTTGHNPLLIGTDVLVRQREIVRARSDGRATIVRGVRTAWVRPSWQCAARRWRSERAGEGLVVAFGEATAFVEGAFGVAEVDRQGLVPLGALTLTLEHFEVEVRVVR